MSTTTSAAPLLILRCLGQAEAVIEPRAPEADYFLGPGKPLALLVWLAAMPGRSCRREQAIDLLWSDVEPEQARHALRQTIWHLRRKLHDSIITATRESLTLGLDVRRDHVDFLDAVAAGRFEEAVSLYTGDFLPNLALPGGVDFEHWADIERRQARLAYLHAARALTRAWIDGSRYREAISLARRIREVDNSEASWRLVLEALIAGRDELGATLEADALEQGFGADPSALEASTRALLRSARHATTSPERARDTGMVAELVGRESEFATLMASWAAAKLGKAVTIRLSGAAGLGKTRLLNDLSARLRAIRARLILVSARPADREVPFAHAADIAAALSSLKGAAAVSPASASALVGLNPSLASTFPAAAAPRHGDDDLLHRSLAIRELVEVVADESPVALLLDDHHWADPESRRLIAAAIGKLEHAPVLVVIATRPGYSEIAISGAQRIDLNPLSGANTVALVSSLGQLPDEPWTSAFCSLLHDVSGGSPLLVLETLHSLIERKLLVRDEGRWQATDAPALLAARSTPNAIDTRVRSSSDVERLTLAIMAIYGAPMRAEVLAGFVKRGERELAGVLAELETRGLVAGDGLHWWPSHDLLAESFSDQLDLNERARLERAIGDHLVAEMRDEPSLVRAARHYASTGSVDAIVGAFIPWLSLRRQRGDMRSVGALATTFASGLADATGLWHQVPFHLRFPRWRGFAMGVAVVVLSLTGITQVMIPRETAPDAELAVWYDSAGRSYQWTVPIRRASLAKDELVEVRAGSMHAAGLTPNRARYVISPDGRHWAGDMTYSDSGGIDVVITDETLRKARRITSPHDDLNPAWSPDGRMLAFVTGRLNRAHLNDIAIYDVATGSVRPLTSGRNVDASPAWSPLGDRIAFSRVLGDRATYQICQVYLDGTMLRCIDIPGATNAYPLGWYDDQRLVVSATVPDTGAGGRHVIRLMDLNDPSATREMYRSPRALFMTLSPDGKWVACACKVTGDGVMRWFVFPLDNPELQGEIVRDRTETQSMMASWSGRRRVGSYLERIEIDRHSFMQPLNAPLKLSATGIRADGRRVEGLTVQWSLVAGAAATLRDDVLTPLRPGVVRIRASAGGWRVAEADITIGAATTELIHTWQWEEPLDREWILFGSPASYVARDSMFGRAYFANGDASFSSGIISRRVFSATEGLVLGASLSARIVERQWQALTIGIIEEPDSLAPDPAPTDSSGPNMGRRGCYGILPSAEGSDIRRTIALSAHGVEPVVVPTGAAVETGAPQSIMLQLFPDGSCGLALNGEIVGRIQIPGTAIHNVRILVHGQSVDTRVALGPLTVSKGTDARLDWRPVTR